MKTNYQELQSRITAVNRRIHHGRKTLATGKNMDLGNLSVEVQNLCDTVQRELALSETPELDKSNFAQKLNEIISDLDELKDEIVADHSSKGGITALESDETD